MVPLYRHPAALAAILSVTFLTFSWADIVHDIACSLLFLWKLYRFILCSYLIHRGLGLEAMQCIKTLNNAYFNIWKRYSIIKMFMFVVFFVFTGKKKPVVSLNKTRKVEDIKIWYWYIWLVWNGINLVSRQLSCCCIEKLCECDTSAMGLNWKSCFFFQCVMVTTSGILPDLLKECQV